jgi:hypothetical protein
MVCFLRSLFPLDYKQCASTVPVTDCVNHAEPVASSDFAPTLLNAAAKSERPVWTPARALAVKRIVSVRLALV